MTESDMNTFLSLMEENPTFEWRETFDLCQVFLFYHSIHAHVIVDNSTSWFEYGI
jgi:hypothetical protein